MDSKNLAIICITFLEAIAMLKGIDGSMFGMVIGFISGLAGYYVGKRKKERM